MQLNHSGHVQLAWPDDFLSAGSDGQLMPINQERALYAESQGCCQEAQKKRTFFRPQVTVNLFNAGGSSMGGSSAGGLGTGGSGMGGSGTGGTATIHGNNASRGSDAVSAHLASQLAALSEKVEQLSLRPFVRGIEFESGMWNTMDVRPWNQPRPETKGRIAFSKDFGLVPEIMVSICSADVSNQSNFRVRVYATDVDLKGFTIHVDAWGGTELYSCGVSWIAIEK